MRRASQSAGMPPSAFSVDPWLLLRNRRAMSRAIAAVTGTSPSEVRRVLWREFLFRGGTVRRAAKEAGVTPYVFDEAMARLYATTDAFLYELAIWNMNLLKRHMRAWVKQWVTSALGPRRRVLSWGGGLGFESLALAEAGHDVTHFDLPGWTSTFAAQMLGASHPGVRLVTDSSVLGDGEFDVVVCLDVLEHVPDVRAELQRIRACLKPGGVLVVHAPFYFIHRAAVTHLRVHRQHSGSLALFRRAGLSLIDAQPTWAPLVLTREDGRSPRRPLLAWPRLGLALPVGLVWSIGRFTALPFELVNLFTRLAQPWYVDDMFGRGAARAGPDVSA